MASRALAMAKVLMGREKMTKEEVFEKGVAIILKQTIKTITFELSMLQAIAEMSADIEISTEYEGKKFSIKVENIPEKEEAEKGEGAKSERD
jgi:hypothetical protein